MSDILSKAIDFSSVLLAEKKEFSGEPVLSHCDGVCHILWGLGASQELQAAIYLSHVCDVLNKPKETLAPVFGNVVTDLSISTHKIFQLQKTARDSSAKQNSSVSQIEHVRRMLLAFSKDLRVIMVLLASQLQHLKFITATKLPLHEEFASLVLNIFAPLANRLGIWQIKWEMEDLSFRILEPLTYKEIALRLEAKRHVRELEIETLKASLIELLSTESITAEIQGRPKNIFSIVKKMRGKSLGFEQVFDLRAVRIIVDKLSDCYRCLSLVHQNYVPVDGQYDDYISKPKANGYQSLHTVVNNSDGHAVEIQIRTRAMHEHAEFGVAAHWAYKEAGIKGYGGFSASSDQTQRMAVLRQLLAWERELSSEAQSQSNIAEKTHEERIYVLTPEASIIELSDGATPIDFAYAVHTELGHRCRGAKVDGVLVPLSTPLVNGQTVEITAAKEGGPSRDWLNPDLKFIGSQRSKSKIRAWFNFQKAQETIARGRELVEKTLQREGKTALKFEDLAKQLGFETADQLFEVVGKDELSLRQIEISLRPAVEPEPVDDKFLRKFQSAKIQSSQGNVLVVGVDSLLTQLAKCCRPAPPDLVKGYVTKGKGVSVHRAACANFLQLQNKDQGRVIEVAWNSASTKTADTKYAVDIQILADDRQGLLRDVSEVFAKEKINVIGVKTQSVHEMARMTFTVEILDTLGLGKVLTLVGAVDGVRHAHRQ
ncbi:MAG: bifunctional (p)ppGpp synthetase/guanosine-3',5'-bis(diphosphate) 3'-pyrophosphohydrolase [Betaproteobacteria bacterium]|nr:bifunctional (p)ppGpp synthetase/guanosine-3',5'-bis(diphosphate) 3'-pyrophosphohydrolase [Betaproteobacteria bacterium]